MTDYLALFVRGLIIVTLTAANVIHVNTRRWRAAFITGFLLSWVWWGNVFQASHPDMPGAGEVYALGAACGTMLGMWIGLAGGKRKGGTKHGDFTTDPGGPEGSSGADGPRPTQEP